MKNKYDQLTYVSLYCGCGGFDEGFIENNFQCLGAFDIDPIAVDVYKKNIGPYAHVCDLSGGKLPFEISKHVDVVISGSPCQGFSTVGKRKFNDPRNNLLLIGGEIALKLKTKIFIAENVMGSVSGKHKLYWRKLEKMFTQHNYEVKFLKCEATSFGIPQLRKRILMIACQNELDLNIDIKQKKQKSLKEVLHGSDKLPNHDVVYLEENSNEYRIARKIMQGQKLSNVRGSDRSVHTWDIPEVFGKVSKKEERILLEIMKLRRRIRKRKKGDADPVEIARLESAFGKSISKTLNDLENKGYIRRVGNESIDLAHTFNGKYRRLNYSYPSPTVDTRFGSAKYFLHPEEHRALTVREAARIQGFRDSFIFCGATKNQFQMIGNAVPPPISIEIAGIIKRKLLLR